MRRFFWIFFLFAFLSAANAEDLSRQVRKAVERSTLNQPGTKPFHLKAVLAPSFERDKESGRSGEVEIWWTSPSQWKREIRSPEFHQIEIVSNGHDWQKHEGDYFPEWLRETAVQLINPLPDPEQVLEHVKTADESKLMGQIHLAWTATTGTTEVKNIQRFSVALRSSTGLLLYTYGFGWGAEFKDYQKFHGLMVARTVNVGSPQVTAKVQTLDDLGRVPAGFFEADPASGDPKPLETKLIDEPTLRKNLLPMEPIVWPTVHDGPFTGSVTTWIVIDREGRIREIEGPVTENAAMEDAGKEALAKMRFKPFQVDGIPVQVMSQFTLPFRTSRPAGSENFESAQTYFESGRKAGFLAAAQKSPYILRAEFQFGGHDVSVQKGHYEDTWLGQDHWLRRAAAGDDFCERSQDGEQRYRNSGGSQAKLLCLVLKVLEPIPAIDTFTESDWKISRETLDGTSTVRLLAGRENQSRGYWFNDAGLLLRANLGGAEIRRSQFEDFDGVKIARRIDVLKDGGLIMPISVTEVTPAGTVSPESFQLKGHEWQRAFTDEVR
jgi:hypothetical protein